MQPVLQNFLDFNQEQLETYWLKLAEEIYGDAWSIRREAPYVDGKDIGPKIDLQLSQLLLRVSAAMTINTMLMKKESD